MVYPHQILLPPPPELLTQAAEPVVLHEEVDKIPSFFGVFYETGKQFRAAVDDAPVNQGRRLEQAIGLHGSHRPSIKCRQTGCQFFVFAKHKNSKRGKGFLALPDDIIISKGKCYKQNFHHSADCKLCPPRPKEGKKRSLSLKQRRRFLIARHGQTNYNKEGRVQGTLDEGVFLNYAGIAQSSSLGVYLARRQLANAPVAETDGSGNQSPITRAYCSPMQRCRQTYAAISGVCSGRLYMHSSDSNGTGSIQSQSGHIFPEPTILPNLKEIELCEWQGRLKSDVASNDVENWNMFQSQPTNLRLNQGTFAPVLDCWERANGNWNVIRSECVRNKAGVVFIMCHGAIGQAMLLHALGLDIELFGKSKRFAFDNCDCFEVEWCDKEEVAIRWRRAYPVESKWEECMATKKMCSTSLVSSR